MNILLIANELRYTCGVTNHLLHLAGGLSKISANKIYIICGGGNGIERFKEINAETIKNQKFLHEKRTPLNYLSAIRFLKKVIKENKINIIHSHSHYAANIASRAAKNTNVTTIQTNHGLLEEKGRLKHFIADKYIALNEHIYDYIINNKIAAEKNVKLIRCGIPVPAKPPKKNNAKLKIITASRFTPEKGLDIFIKAVSLLAPDTREKAEFYIAGEGETENELKKLNKKLNAGIEFLGSVKNMYNTLAETDVVVFTSRSSTEGFPAIITEAGANHNLVITSNFNALGNMVENNVTGLVFETENYNELSQYLGNVINNPQKIKPMAEKFYYKVKELFNVDEMIDKHLEMYKAAPPFPPQRRG